MTALDLEKIPSVSHTDAWGNQIEKGGSPPNKLYRKTTLDEAVDYRVAASNFVKRRSGKMSIIPGGLDDEDEKLYVDPVMNRSGVKYAQRSALTDEDIAKLKSGTKEHIESEANDSSASSVPEPGHPVVLPPAPPDPPPEKDDQQVKKARRRSRQGEPEVIEKVVYKDRIVEKVVEKPSPFDTWKKKRTRVQISTQETTFVISAIDAVRSEHGVALLLPTSDDAMTFIPKVAARVKISSRELGVLNTAFTGVSFDIEELGVLGLTFLVLDEAKARSENTNTNTQENKL